MSESLTLAEWDAGHIKRSRAVADKIVPTTGTSNTGGTFKKAVGYKEALAELRAWRALHPIRPFGGLEMPSVSHRAQSAAAPKVPKSAPVKRTPVQRTKATPAPLPSSKLESFAATKHCPRCFQDLPRNSDHWNAKRANPDGFDDYCRPCKRAYNNAYAANKRRIEKQKETANAG